MFLDRKVLTSVHYTNLFMCTLYCQQAIVAHVLHESDPIYLMIVIKYIQYTLLACLEKAQILTFISSF